MQVSQLLSRFLDNTSPIKRTETTEATDTQQPSDSPTQLLAPNGSTRELRDILSRYNVNDITPRKFTEMLQSLKQAGTITDDQFQELSAIRTQLDANGIAPDEEVDLVQFCTKQLQEAQDNDAKPATVATAQRQLDWLRKCALIQSTPGTATLDSLA
jgi:hypothetical protein